MTVGELIDMLGQVDSDMPVVLEPDINGRFGVIDMIAVIIGIAGDGEDTLRELMGEPSGDELEVFALLIK